MGPASWATLLPAPRARKMVTRFPHVVQLSPCTPRRCRCRAGTCCNTERQHVWGEQGARTTQLRDSTLCCSHPASCSQQPSLLVCALPTLEASSMSLPQNAVLRPLTRSRGSGSTRTRPGRWGTGQGSLPPWTHWWQRTCKQRRHGGQAVKHTQLSSGQHTQGRQVHCVRRGGRTKKSSKENRSQNLNAASAVLLPAKAASPVGQVGAVLAHRGCLAIALVAAAGQVR